MSSILTCCSNMCNHICRVGLLIIVGMGIASSVMAAMSCDFLLINEDRVSSVEAPFPPIELNSISIFFFIGKDFPKGQCQVYDAILWDSEFDLWYVISQFCALIAPSLAFLGLMAILVEVLFCRYRGSAVLPVLLFLMATLAQGGTFALLGETDFCFDETTSPSPVLTGCTMSFGAYYSIAACLFYYMSSIWLCCIPRREPMCRDCCSRSDSKTKSNDREEPEQYPYTQKQVHSMRGMDDQSETRLGTGSDDDIYEDEEEEDLNNEQLFVANFPPLDQDEEAPTATVSSPNRVSASPIFLR